MATRRILAIATNVGEYEKVGYRPGLWLGEFTHFLDAVGQSIPSGIGSPTDESMPIDLESLMFEELGHAIGPGGPVRKWHKDRA